MPDAACTTCNQKVATCTQTKCPLPSCYTAGQKTCADLKACCDKIADSTKKTVCTQTYEAIKTADTSCNAVYPQYSDACP